MDIKITSDNHLSFTIAINQLAKVRDLFKDLENNKITGGNDNIIGDIGEYWGRRFYEYKGVFKKL